MKWITRERPKIDRIACPWLIARFIDDHPEFLYVPANEVMKIAADGGATPYDMPGVELGHHGERCSFDAFIDKYRLDDAALHKLALIVRGADCDHRDECDDGVHDPDHDDAFLRDVEKQCQARFPNSVLAREKMEITF